MYHATATYHAIADGASHSYRFYSVGVDDNGNTEAAPAVLTLDLILIGSFAAPTELEVTQFDVQHGAKQRSFVRYVDVYFNMSAPISAIVDTLADGDDGNDRLQLVRFDLDGGDPGDVIDMSGVASAVDQVLEIDFGEEGIGGNRNSAIGDGYYQLSLDLDGDGALETDLYFYRLLGDADGDGRVRSSDLSLVNAMLGQQGDHLAGDLNGDGHVTILDRLLWYQSRRKRLEKTLHIDD